MPKDSSIKSVLAIGSNPGIIAQTCEFDYSASQASKTLREDALKCLSLIQILQGS